MEHPQQDDYNRSHEDFEWLAANGFPGLSTEDLVESLEDPTERRAFYRTYMTIYSLPSTDEGTGEIS